ncbi:MAG: hypothetical protein LBF34_04410 [Puniceicoccales bacterium]|jgi:hypothetical protein|nr:hypothetical protein [Puniceicoccales bacterium]
MFNRKARQCRERWKNYLAPDLNFSPWTRENDALLREKFNELGPKWAQIARFFPNKTDLNCKNRWRLFQKRERRRLQLNPPALPPQDDLISSVSHSSAPLPPVPQLPALPPQDDLTWDDTEDFCDQH